MYDWRQISDMNYRISLAKAHAPKDIFTKAATFLLKVVSLVSLILTPVQIVTTALGGCLIAITFGVFSLVLSVIWWPLLLLLLGSSWLWLRAWYLRPILLVPGVLVSAVASLYVILAPEPEKDAKYAKLSIAGEWPLTWYLIKPPAEYYEVKAETEQIIEQDTLGAKGQLPPAEDVKTCFYHEGRGAVNRCSECGQSVCSECDYVIGTQPICRNCWDKRVSA
jgi:hypothetical protein